MILTCENIKKSFGTDVVLDDISFLLNKGEKVAIVGVNGAGKTTLFKILTGEYKADSGNFVIPKEISIGYLAQNASLDTQNEIYTEMLSVFSDIIEMEQKLRELEQSMANLTGDELESVMKKYATLNHTFEERKGYEYKSRIRGVLKGLGFTEDEYEQPIYQLSGGQKTRVSLGKLLLTNPEILLLDEPTNHLDIESIMWLEDFLRTYSGCVIVISHDRYFLNKIVDKVIEIENHKSAVYNGNYTMYASKKIIDREIKLKHYMNQQKDIAHQEAVIKKLRSFNREKSIKRAESREKMLDKLERVDKPEDLPDNMKLRFSPIKESGNDVLRVKDLAKSFDEQLFKNVSFDVFKGEKIALIGPNGIGKTTLFKMILETLKQDEGTITIGANVKIGYYDQEQENLDLSKSLFNEISDAYPNMTNTEIRNILASFLFTNDDVFKQISTLSGGEKGRVSLTKIVLGGANFLILDEPTNHLDMFSKEILEETLRNFTGTLLYISHDRYFINNTAEKIVELTKDGATMYLGNYDYYLQKKAEKPIIEEVEENNSEIKENWVNNKKNQAEDRRIKARIRAVESEIEKHEKNIQEIDLKMTLPDVYANPILAKEAVDEKTKIEEELELLLIEWEELAEN